MVEPHPAFECPDCGNEFGAHEQDDCLGEGVCRNCYGLVECPSI